MRVYVHVKSLITYELIIRVSRFGYIELNREVCTNGCQPLIWIKT